MARNSVRSRRVFCAFVLAFCWFFIITSCNSSSPQTITTSEGFKEINGTQLFYKVIGTGTPLFVLHGGPGDSHRYLLPHLEELAKDYQLILYDQRGTGQSDGQIDSSTISVDQFVEDLEALRVSLGQDKVSLLGHSWGADLAMFYAIKYPEHLDRLILVDPGPINAQFQAQADQAFQQRLSSEEQQVLTEACGLAEATRTPEAVEACVKSVDPVTFHDISNASRVDTTVSENTAKNVFTIQATLFPSIRETKSNIEDKLRSLSVPTTIIHGEEDWIPKESSEHIHSLIPGSKIFIIKESGHMPFVEQPDAFFAAVRDT